ncbi:MAG: hypothetical protein A2Z38_09250 [Planctomycetes bacterium RBG_19FT_COMBO_48_8]|nr:MAG: hypothetical protein A2Z38_09250 [Planctomycetes bacterium RBG_19FT_COMBO_48_8]
MDAGFKYSFYTNNREFTFQDSKGTRTDVTSFSDRTEVRDSNYEKIREQVEILYYRYGQQGSADEFAVYLCKYTEPYQVVLARMPRGDTLDATLNEAQKYISDFKRDSDYEVLRKLRPIDSLIAPDILYKLTHHFKDLEWKNLKNPKWQDYFIFEARQMVHFSLSRTGVILKSEVRMGVAAGMPDPRREQPRHFYFDRPFLIYVKKRGPDYSPFFAMWVDNAELLEKF